MTMKIKILILFFTVCCYAKGSTIPIQSDKEHNTVTRIDMSEYKTINFDNLVKNISCTRLESNLFDYGITMTTHKDRLYIMGRTIAGNKVVIFDKSGQLVKELTFADALLVISMAIIPDAEELWVVSRFKIINKFKLDGTPIKRVSLPFPCANLIPVGQQNFLVYSGGTCNSRGSIEGHFLALTDFKSINKLFLPKWGKEEWPSAPQNIYAQDEKANNLFIFPNDIDTIYSYNQQKGAVYPFLFLDFHGDFLTKDKHPYGPGEDQEMSEIITKRKYIYSHYSFNQASGKLFFKLVGKREDFCSINLKNNVLYSFNRLFDNFMPISYNPFIGSDGKNLYVLVQEKELAEHYQNIKCTYPAIQRLLPALSPDGNSWILLTIEIKE
ncbi:hypothetical protein PRABACTJOHN_04271 [Parabacteroides johnsonii DSM 18315]|jgi:hypothetical protein|uniref:6-bladed beta-propeller n=2 Tax=Parabacteroides johnsonii TaxID=387661 RepID=B7BGS2_9BACT|nr:hypothetical protein PRABACTJOHN_04271 [Parabacteroides johnsonii DSM 18315]